MPKNIAPEEWKFIPSLKGKHATRHIFILETLMSKGPKSYCDMALEYLQLEPKFSTLNKANQYYRQRSENSTFYKRCRFLEEKDYVKKFGSLYKLSPKGAFLVLAVNPKILGSASRDFLDDTNDLQKPEWLSGVNEEDTIKSFQDGFKSNPIGADVLSFAARKILLAYKINLDEISSKDLFSLLYEKTAAKLRKPS
jgi:hypothetical protein